jgi:hypothetical protein
MVYCTHNTTTSISWDIILNFILTLQKPCPKSWSTNDINGYRSFSNILLSRIFTAYLFPGPSRKIQNHQISKSDVPSKSCLSKCTESRIGFKVNYRNPPIFDA